MVDSSIKINLKRVNLQARYIYLAWSISLKNFVLIIFCLFLISCQSTQPKSNSLQFGVNLNAHPELTEAERSLWFGFSFGLGTCIQNEGASYNNFPISCEVTARTIMAQMYENEPDKSVYKDVYASELYSVYKAGFIEQYVWFFHNQKEWNKPSNIEKYKIWASKNLTTHNQQTKFVGKYQ
ncbi:hypothetical protein [Pseudoalteromonas sp. 10-33]|uniref:hypothetical protein n=1 Tax=Pseudoalteromonas sp. 10-33 TaxID=1761890 RepID=UPI0007320BC6|nr:hypothetical protein [Pseudoalteromonas sp. 10-33]KTF12989.1 hypothetical protein ATS76_18715 [Pseudoalteromonas sp. 10-33]